LESEWPGKPETSPIAITPLVPARRYLIADLSDAKDAGAYAFGHRQFVYVNRHYFTLDK
jgi:hypothetical protein